MLPASAPMLACVAVSGMKNKPLLRVAARWVGEGERQCLFNSASQDTPGCANSELPRLPL
jgi:hypothetical protein